MSTEFYTEPPIEYEVFLAATHLSITEPRRQVYTLPHQVLGHSGNWMMCFKQQDGSVWFERFGGNSPYFVFMNILEHFPVRIFDQYGLSWPLESGG